MASDIRILLRTHTTADERYDVAVPNKTIYVSEGDLKLFARAQELAGGNLSAAISKALKRFVDVEEGLREGFDDVVVRVGTGAGRKVRFTAVLVGEWMDTVNQRVEHYRVWRGRTGKYVLHVEREAGYWQLGADGKPVGGWKGGLGIGIARFGSTPKEQVLEVLDSLDELFLKVPSELYDIVARSARQPTVEELDI
jgi:EXLDI family protein